MSKNIEKKIVRTFKELRRFNAVYQEMLRAKPEIALSKFGYAVKRFIEMNLTKVQTDYNSELAEIRIDHALTEPNGALMVNKSQGPGNDREFCYDKEGLKKLIKAELALEKRWDTKEFNLTPYIAKEVPKLSDEQEDAFKGLVC